MCKRLFCLLLVYFSFFIAGCGEGLPQGAVKIVDNIPAPENFSIQVQNQSNVLIWKQEEGLTYTIYWSTQPDVLLSGSQRLDRVKSPVKHENLINGTAYYYVILAQENDKIGDASITLSGTPNNESPLSAPENFRLESRNAQITLTWKKVPNADKYKIYWTTDSEEDPRFSSNRAFETDFNFFSHSRLENNTKYYYVITAIVFDTESEATEKRWAAPGFIVPETPSNLEIEEFGDKSVTINWGWAKNATQYKVYWSTSSADFDVSAAKSATVKEDENDFILHGLQRGNIYYIKVAGVNDGGEGLASDSIEVDFSGQSTGTDLSIIPPKKVIVAVVGRTAEIEWETANTRYNYLVYYSTEPGITKENISSLENNGVFRFLKKPNHTIDNLLIGRVYYAVIVSVLGDKESIVSEEISFLVKISDDFFFNSDIQNGAKLYTQWWRGAFDGPTGNNPIWQDAAKDGQGAAINSAQNLDTWRCAECHGWDYRGKSGEYGIGSKNYTGFPGLLDAAVNRTREEIYAFIRNGITANNRAHSFKSVGQANRLDTQEALDLTRFIMSEVPKSLRIWEGEASVGAIVFSQKNTLGNACQDSACHEDLPTLESEKKRLLDSAIEQPARFIHYTRFGVGLMPAGQSLDSARNVLAFLWEHSLDELTSNFQQDEYDKTGAALYDQWARGGLLYDRWWLANELEQSLQPAGNHPLWPSKDTTVNGPDTWRCKECHGWDYKGKSGAYGKGLHFTGITGITGLSTKIKSVPEMYTYLRIGDKHAFSRYISDTDIYALTRFVMEIRKEDEQQFGTVDLLDAIKQQPVEFSASLGESLYNDSITFGGCITCHVVNDFQWQFSDSDPARGELQTLDGIAKNNPGEFLHKIRYGHPGSNMRGIIQYESTTPQAAINILGYAQTSLAPNVKRGGRLYDNWWLENKLTKPTTMHVLWPADGIANRPGETWRCESCHGWDYNGELGIKGVNNTIRNVQSFIEGGTFSNELDHAFSSELKRQDIFDLSAFIQSTENTGVRSDIDLLIANADSFTGEVHYISTTPGNCINCHGEFGTSIPNVDIDSSANKSAARFIHKARFGSPGSIMVPSLVRFTGLTAVQAADVQAYAKTIASSALVNDAGLDRGGRLFDNWFKEMKTADDTVQDPVIVNPLWESRKAGIPDLQSLSDSWRCVSCHNWNYKGIDLLSIDTDADNLLQKVALRRSEFPNEIDLANYFYNWIKNGSGGLHNYGSSTSGLPSVLGDREIKELVAFITQGIIDTSEYIYNINGKVIRADVINGNALYTGALLVDINCASCHGESGESLPPGGSGNALDIFALADTNPWRFLHKVRFASSGTQMPALTGIPGSDFQQALDVLSFAQEEFSKRP